MMMWWDSPLFDAKAISNLLVPWVTTQPQWGNTPVSGVSAKGAGLQPGHLYLHLQTILPPTTKSLHNYRQITKPPWTPISPLAK